VSPTEVHNLYEAHRHSLWNAAVHLLRDAAAAEDVLHDVFARLLDRGVAPNHPRAYLLRSVVHAARDFQRRRRPSSIEDSGHHAVEPIDPSPSPAGRVQADETAGGIVAALAALPLQQREVVVLHGFEGLSFRQVGQLCGVSLNTAASRWRLACIALRTHLNRQGIRP